MIKRQEVSMEMPTMKEERTIVIDIRLTRRVVVALVGVLTIVALFAYLTLTGESVVASGGESPLAQSSGMRQFYLSQSGAAGSSASTMCADGYHMASLWEIADPSNLKYNTTLGHTVADSGQGPPTDGYFISGWVRTGYVAVISTSSTVGRANCGAWTIHNISYWGTTAMLPSTWTSGSQDIGVWQLDVSTCDTYNPVWCIED
jgi:hypothetical protein